MGLFSKFFKHTEELNKLANAVANVKKLLDDIENNSYTDLGDWLVIAWVCRVGIIDIIENGDMLMSYKVYIPINGHNTPMTIQEAYLMSVGRLSFKSGQLSGEYRDAISSVLDKGYMFDEIDNIIPEDKKKIFKVL
jgi:hypothetical protein